MKDSNCGYCVHGEPLAKFGIFVCDLKASSLVLYKEQSHPGRCIVAFKDHVGDLDALSDEDRDAYFSDISRVAKALRAAFHPDKINYGSFGDTAGHLHFHLVPKYKDQFEWGGMFSMDPKQKFLTDAEYQEIIDKIKAHL